MTINITILLYYYSILRHGTIITYIQWQRNTLYDYIGTCTAILQLTLVVQAAAAVAN